MGKKNIIVLSIIAILVISILVVSSGKKDEFRQNDKKEFEKIVMKEQTEKCLKENGYSIDTPTAEEREKCEKTAKSLWDEAITLNPDGN